MDYIVRLIICQKNTTKEWPHHLLPTVIGLQTTHPTKAQNNKQETVNTPPNPQTTGNYPLTSCLIALDSLSQALTFLGGFIQFFRKQTILYQSLLRLKSHHLLVQI